MNSDVEAAWNSDPVIDESIEEPLGFGTEPPLHYAALLAQSQPVDGKVTPARLHAILQRADIPRPKVAEILMQATEHASGMIPSAAFYWSLYQAACAQLNEFHEIPEYLEGAPVDYSVPLQLKEEDSVPEAEEFEPELDYDPTVSPKIGVTLSTKTAGSYLFKHSLYAIDGEFGGQPIKVLRRYRDFATLAEFLTRKYTFRVVPVLPPKRLTVNGRYLVGGDQDAFLLQRAAGLARFLNLVVEHPVLSQDKMVAEFLVELAYYPTKPLYTEMDGRSAHPLFISQWQPDNLRQWNSVELATEEFLAQITSMCLLLEKRIKRSISAESDAVVWAQNYTTLADRLGNVYPTLQDDVGAIQQRLRQGAQYAESEGKVCQASRADVVAGPLVQLKLYREMLVSVLDLFKRIRQWGGNTIPELEKKISTAQGKLTALASREDAREDELHKLRMTIQSAQTTIREQTNRDWQIKMIVSQELKMIQTMQYQVSQILRSMAALLTTDLGRRTEIVTTFADAAESSPMKI